MSMTDPLVGAWRILDGDAPGGDYFIFGADGVLETVSRGGRQRLGWRRCDDGVELLENDAVVDVIPIASLEGDSLVLKTPGPPGKMELERSEAPPDGGALADRAADSAPESGQAPSPEELRARTGRVARSFGQLAAAGVMMQMGQFLGANPFQIDWLSAAVRDQIEAFRAGAELDETKLAELSDEACAEVVAAVHFQGFDLLPFLTEELSTEHFVGYLKLVADEDTQLERLIGELATLLGADESGDATPAPPAPQAVEEPPPPSGAAPSSESPSAGLPTFDYEAIDAKGQRSSGTIEAADEGAAIAALKEQGAFPTKLTRAAASSPSEDEAPDEARDEAPDEATTAESGAEPADPSAPPTVEEQALLAAGLCSLLRLNVPILEAFAVLKRVTRNEPLDGLLTALDEGLRQGDDVTTVLKRHAFLDAALVEAVKGGEQIGELDGALHEHADAVLGHAFARLSESLGRTEVLRAFTRNMAQATWEGTPMLTLLEEATADLEGFDGVLVESLRAGESVHGALAATGSVDPVYLAIVNKAELDDCLEDAFCDLAW